MSDVKVKFLRAICDGYSFCTKCFEYEEIVATGQGQKNKRPGFYELRDENNEKAMDAVTYLINNIDDDDLKMKYTKALFNCARCLNNDEGNNEGKHYNKTHIADALSDKIEENLGIEKEPDTKG